jgi:predicted secreted hydrolase
MLYRLRDGQDDTHPASSGTWVDPLGAARHLEAKDFRITVTDFWNSPASGATYPSGWRIRIPSLDLSVAVSPAMADQEMKTPETTGVVYWEGSVEVQGSRGGEPVRGVGYTELTGYAAPFDAPM